MRRQCRAVLSLVCRSGCVCVCGGCKENRLQGWTGGTDAKTREMKFLRDDASALRHPDISSATLLSPFQGWERGQGLLPQHRATSRHLRTPPGPDPKFRQKPSLTVLCSSCNCVSQLICTFYCTISQDKRQHRLHAARDNSGGMGYSQQAAEARQVAYFLSVQALDPGRPRGQLYGLVCNTAVPGHRSLTP